MTKRPKKPRRQKEPGVRRLQVLVVLFALAFFVIFVRLSWIQVVEAPAYSDIAKSQRMRDVELAPRRGTIYDREGEPLAVSVEAKSIFASPSQVRDKELTSRELARVLGGEEGTYLERLSSTTGFVYLARKVDLDRASELQALDLDGIGFIDDFQRLYPSGELACQVLGFVGIDDEGLAGIEKRYESYLGGTPGVALGERDPKGRPIPGGVQRVIEPVHGQDIILTIDKDIQYLTQVELAKTVEKWGAKSASGIVMNPKTGEIYAMATVPGFNPNRYGEADAETIRNRPLTDAYEPGSTLKCLTAAAVIEKGLFTPESKLNLPSTIKIGGRTIKESQGRAAVRWTLTEIVARSSNVGTVKLGLKLGEKGLYDAFADFGLTEVPATDFPGTTKGWLPPTDQWSPSSIGNIPFGQGVSVTSAQLARAVAAIANDGVLTTPHFLLEAPHSGEKRPVWSTRRAISAETARTVTRMLETVVTEGTGKDAAVPGYTVAGKTGTAQKPRAGGGGYAGGGYVSSFIGFLPAEDPRVLICITVDQPTRAIYGGVVAGPAFSQIGRFTVAHLKIPPASISSTTAVNGKITTASVGPVTKPGPGQ